jgi:hypothetical protein
MVARRIHFAVSDHLKRKIRAGASYAVALRRCGSIARSRRLREEQGGFAAAANLKFNYYNTLN